MVSQNLFGLLDLIPSLKLPSHLEPYREPICDEIRWTIHSLYLMGRRRRINSNPYVFLLFGVHRFLEYYNKHKLLPYYNVYDFCELYGFKRQAYYNREYGFRKYFEKYQKN